MTKTKEELIRLKQDCIELANKLKQLNEEELIEVVGGEDTVQRNEKEIEFIFIRGTAK